MRRREEAVVGPAPQHVAAVHEGVAVERGSVDPASVLGAKRQAGHLVLGQQRQEACIAMRRDAELIFRQTGNEADLLRTLSVVSLEVEQVRP